MASTDRKYLISEEELYNFIYCENALWALQNKLNHPDLQSEVEKYEDLYVKEHPIIKDFYPMLNKITLSEIAVYELRNEFQPYTR